eukprot:TRINITY_DN5170_c0_g1_i4.p1 TRINITY_DN5170_c0_g1~~TRINITY_DN5170_c0_g1_i4.p1  ORF type:complete len:211 (-),score=57.70 TRINITY_DN5170_c0_g1_i4:72-704(-)
MLIPLVKKVKQCILVGDAKQLGPIYIQAKNAGLSRSLFERLSEFDFPTFHLQVQYRMHPCISQFPSKTFYGGNLKNGITEKDRQNKALGFPWKNPNKPIMFVSVHGREEYSSSATSFVNTAEILMIEKIIAHLLRCGIPRNDIGVITPYEGQRSLFCMEFRNMQEIEISSVDAFQGREKDYIIISCVRSNPFDEIGFLGDDRRMNVLLTR